MTSGTVFLIIVLIALNGFFVSVEFAIAAARRVRLELPGDQDSPAARRVKQWIDQPAAHDRLIAATQLGIALTSLGLGVVSANAFEAMLAPLFERAILPQPLAFLQAILPALPLAISLLVIAGLQVVFGEQAPKAAALHAPERLALATAPLMTVFIALFKGYVSLLNWVTRGALSLVGVPANHGYSMLYAEEEPHDKMANPEVESTAEPAERENLPAPVDFGQLIVRQVSVPRTEIIAVEANAPIDEVLDLSTEHGLTKIPVYEGSLDEVIGIVHLRDLVRVMRESERNGSNGGNGRLAREMAREAVFVPETISVNDLMREFRAKRTHIAIVLDEYGGTAGLVTLEDVLEEIVGDVRDPFETAPPSIQMQPDGTAVIDGMSLIDEINDYFDLKLIDPYYDTIAGYILGRLGRITKVGDSIEDTDNKIRLEVLKMDRLRIERVHLRRLA